MPKKRFDKQAGRVYNKRMEAPMNDVKQQADKIVSDFMQNRMKTSLRNRLGNVIWPMAQRFIQGFGALLAMSVVTAAAANPVASVIGVVGCWGVSRVVGSHLRFLQNMALGNAAVLGRSMVKNNVPADVRQMAIKRLLQRGGPRTMTWAYIRKHPDAFRGLADGHPAPKLNSLLGLVERNFNRLDRLKGKQRITFAERREMYRSAWQEYRRNRRLEKGQEKPQPDVPGLSPKAPGLFHPKSGLPLAMSAVAYRGRNTPERPTVSFRRQIEQARRGGPETRSGMGISGAERPGNKPMTPADPQPVNTAWLLRHKNESR